MLEALPSSDPLLPPTFQVTGLQGPQVQYRIVAAGLQAVEV